MAGCSEPREGCLDVRAVNFDVRADNACPDCCVFPTLKLTFIHQYIPPSNPDTILTFKYGVPYESPLNPDHLFSVDRFRFYISNVKFTDLQGNVVGVEDSLELQTTSGQTFQTENNFALVDRSIFASATLQNFIAPGQFVRIGFDIGLSDEIRQTDPASVPDGHPLSLASDSLMYDPASGYLSGLLALNRDTISGLDSTVVAGFEPTRFEQVLLPSVTFLEGVNVEVRIQILYNKIFENIDVRTDTEADIRSHLTQNFPNAFRIVAI
ncbi:MAG: hypothetical protein D6714_19960, partial [Bacteroidetes bacterium]